MKSIFLKFVPLFVIEFFKRRRLKSAQKKFSYFAKNFAEAFGVWQTDYYFESELKDCDDFKDSFMSMHEDKYHSRERIFLVDIGYRFTIKVSYIAYLSAIQSKEDKPFFKLTNFEYQSCVLLRDDVVIGRITDEIEGGVTWN